MKLTVIIPTHNPDAGRLQRTLLGLRVQTLPPDEWECFVVNNASAQFPDAAFFATCAPSNCLILDEPRIGLTAARRRGLAMAQGDCAVFVDDDNILAPDYLAQVLALLAAHPRVGALGGRSLPEFETMPPAWCAEFYPLLALRDLGDAPFISQGLRPANSDRNKYPAFAPIGAGLALRRPAWMAWVEGRTHHSAISDRRGNELTSGGDNDIILCAMRASWEVGYFPALSLTHLIPSARFAPDYLARLNRGIQKSWMQVLTLHAANPWPALSPSGATLRKLKAWFTYRPWSSPAARIRWQGACGHFDGRIQS